MKIRVLFRTKADIFAFIDQERGTFGVTRLCRGYGVTRPGYYAWRRRPASRHQEQDRRLFKLITAIALANQRLQWSAGGAIMSRRGLAAVVGSADRG